MSKTRGREKDRYIHTPATTKMRPMGKTSQSRNWLAKRPGNTPTASPTGTSPMTMNTQQKSIAPKVGLSSRRSGEISARRCVRKFVPPLTAGVHSVWRATGSSS